MKEGELLIIRFDLLINIGDILFVFCSNDILLL